MALLLLASAMDMFTGDMSLGPGAIEASFFPLRWFLDGRRGGLSIFSSDSGLEVRKFLL